jgi:carbonic anhydrase
MSMSYRGRVRSRLLYGAAGLALTIGRPAVFGQGHEWGYDRIHGPDTWARLDPNFAACAEGKHQSPIDIRGAKTMDLPPIDFKYQSSPLRVIDNGHTVQMNYAPGSTIRVGGRTYELSQFHFHRPSENYLNGKAFPMELHLVHKNSEGNLAVVAVFLIVGSENPAIKSEWAHIPHEKDKEVKAEGVTIDANQLLPKARGYYTFEGSLTTPPCSEGVAWFVMKEPVTISKAELETFDHLYSHDARPVQQVNDRTVRASK